MWCHEFVSLYVRASCPILYRVCESASYQNLVFGLSLYHFSFFARAKVVKVINSFLKLFFGLKSFVYPPRCKYCNSVVFHPLLYAIDISFLQNLRYFSMFF